MMDEAKKLVNEANELKELCVKMMFESDLLNYMDDECLILYKKMFNLMDTSTKLVLEQAELFDAIDKKLDLLVARSES